MKTKSNAAKCAQLVRKEIKNFNKSLKFRCNSETFSMGDAVRVELNDLSPSMKEELEKCLRKYCYGKFDSMNDYYEVNNDKKDIPQVKYLQICNSISEELRIQIDSYAGFFLRDHPLFEDDKGTLLHRLFTGAVDGFWKWKLAQSPSKII